MSYAYQEDWVHVDDHYKEVEYLKEQIRCLKIGIKNLEEDAAYVLSKIIEIRWRYSDYADIKEEMNFLITGSNEKLKEDAYALLEAEFPTTDGRTPEERWAVPGGGWVERTR